MLKRFAILAAVAGAFVANAALAEPTLELSSSALAPAAAAQAETFKATRAVAPAKFEDPDFPASVNP
jgi:hypothetical protein